MAALVLVDVIGGLWTGASEVTTWGDAWGSKALLAAPVPMVLGQVVATALAVGFERRWAAVPAALLALACVVSVVSGFFDGGLGNDRLEPGMGAYQALLLVVTGVVGLLAATRARQLLAGSAPPGGTPEPDPDPHRSTTQPDQPL